MKRAIYIFSTILLLMVLFLACSEDNNPLPSKAHPENWVNAGSEDFHGLKVLEVGFESCTSCHGKNFEGGDSKVSCFKCHESYPHTEGWVANSEFAHSVYLKASSWNIGECAECHGQTFDGGKSKVTCYKCHASYPHDEDWLVKSSTEFHGATIKASNYDNSSCANCHGTDFKGGSSEVSCYTCHSSYPHGEGWIAGSPNTHGAFLKSVNWSTSSCTSCHGEDLSGGSSEVSCNKCHQSYPHEEGWLTVDDSKFHGEFLEALDFNDASCATCHGQDYQGGETGVSCFTCHQTFPHTEGWLNPSSDGFHGQAIRAANWSMESCKNCHGEDYRGDDTNVSCFTCHTGEDGPESCNTCHGSSSNAAPPQDLSNNTAVTAMGVGRHQLHMGIYNNCSLCHVVPSSLSDEGHIDETPYAEVKSTWGFDRETGTCAFSCHADPNKAYVWNAP